VSDSVGGLVDTRRMELLISALPGVLSGLVGSYAGYRLSGRAVRAADSLSIRREASADLSAPLRDLRSMARRWVASTCPRGKSDPWSSPGPRLSSGKVTDSPRVAARRS
jgi:hypothetical protein